MGTLIAGFVWLAISVVLLRGAYQQHQAEERKDAESIRRHREARVALRNAQWWLERNREW